MIKETERFLVSIINIAEMQSKEICKPTMESLYGELLVIKYKKIFPYLHFRTMKNLHNKNLNAFSFFFRLSLSCENYTVKIKTVKAEDIEVFIRNNNILLSRNFTKDEKKILFKVLFNVANAKENNITKSTVLNLLRLAILNRDTDDIKNIYDFIQQKYEIPKNLKSKASMHELLRRIEFEEGNNKLQFSYLLYKISKLY